MDHFLVSFWRPVGRVFATTGQWALSGGLLYNCMCSTLHPREWHLINRIESGWLGSGMLVVFDEDEGIRALPKIDRHKSIPGHSGDKFKRHLEYPIMALSELQRGRCIISRVSLEGEREKGAFCRQNLPFDPMQSEASLILRVLPRQSP